LDRDFGAFTQPDKQGQRGPARPNRLEGRKRVGGRGPRFI
jgi:hypothetical protein